MTETIKNFEEWIASLTNEEAIKALWERLELAQKDNTLLNKRIEHLEGQLKSLKGVFNSHKHADTTGEATLPASMVNLV